MVNADPKINAFKQRSQESDILIEYTILEADAKACQTDA